MTTQPKKGDTVRIEAEVIDVINGSDYPYKVLLKGAVLNGRISQEAMSHATILDVPLQVEEKWEPKWGEMVEVKDSLDKWYERKFIGFSSKGKPVVESESGTILEWYDIRPIIPPITPEQELRDAMKEKITLELWGVHDSFNASEVAERILNRIMPIIPAWKAKHTPSGKEIKLPSELTEDQMKDKANDLWTRQTHPNRDITDGMKWVQQYYLNGGSFVTTKAEEK